MSSNEEVSIASTSNINKGKKAVKNIGSYPEDPVWSYFTKGKQVEKEKYEATCNLCRVTWNYSKPSELENHLANHYQKADLIIIHQFLTKFFLIILNKEILSIKNIYKLCDFSDESHTANFLASKIEDVLDSISAEHFAAI
ncbi:1852_t:CDS:2, partial [Gigaspora margarita]